MIFDFLALRVPLEELRIFLREVRPPRIHFLGAVSDKLLTSELEVLVDIELSSEHLWISTRLSVSPRDRADLCLWPIAPFLGLIEMWPQPKGNRTNRRTYLLQTAQWRQYSASPYISPYLCAIGRIIWSPCF
jgi:hypothetical protein